MLETTTPAALAGLTLTLPLASAGQASRSLRHPVCGTICIGINPNFPNMSVRDYKGEWSASISRSATPSPEDGRQGQWVPTRPPSGRPSLVSDRIDRAARLPARNAPS